MPTRYRTIDGPQLSLSARVMLHIDLTGPTISQSDCFAKIQATTTIRELHVGEARAVGKTLFFHRKPLHSNVRFAITVKKHYVVLPKPTTVSVNLILMSQVQTGCIHL